MIEVKCAYDRTADIETVIPNPRNPNKHSKEQIELLAKIIKAQGWRAPIVVSTRSGFIVKGHARLAAAAILNERTVPVDDQVYASEAEEWADMIADNRIAELADLDEHDLATLLADFDPDFDIELTGFTPDEVKEMLSTRDNEKSDDLDEHDRISEPEEPQAALGDVYRLGRHLVACGDARDEKILDRLVSASQSDVQLAIAKGLSWIFTDPPYGIDIVSDRSGQVGETGRLATNRKYRKIAGDDEPFDPAFLFRLCDNVILFGANYYHLALPADGQWLVWDKRRPPEMQFSDCELLYTSRKDHTSVVKYTCTWHGMIREGESAPRVHPTQKPLKLCRDIITDFTKVGDIILDPFAGSGSILIACEQTGRTCLSIEIDPLYVDVICDRYEGLTGNVPELISHA